MTYFLPLQARDINNLHRRLLTDPDSPQLDALFKEWGLPASILNKLRQQDLSLGVGFILKKLMKKHYSQELKDDYLKIISDMLTGNTMTLAMRCYLISRPELVKAFEKLTKLPITGDYYQCVDNYRKTRYTRDSWRNLKDHSYVLTYASYHGHAEVLSACLEIAVPGTLKTHHLQTMLCQGHRHLFDTYVSTVEVWPRNYRRMFIRAGLLTFIEKSELPFEDADDREVTRSGELEIVIKYLELQPQAVSTCLKTAIHTGRVQIVKYLQEHYPQLAGHIFDRIMNFAYSPELCEIVLNQNNVNSLVSYIPGTYYSQIIAKYGHCLQARQCLIICRYAVSTYDRDLFDLISPLVIRNNCDCRMTLVRAIQNRSKYFFDQLLTFHRVENPIDAFRESVRIHGRNYFFDQIYQKFGGGFSVDTYGQALDDSVKSSNWDIFIFLLSINRTSLGYSACAAQRALGLNKIDYLSSLLQKVNLADHRLCFYTFDRGGEVLPTPQILDLILEYYDRRILPDVFYRRLYPIGTMSLNHILNYTDLILTYVEDIDDLTALLGSLIMVDNTKMESIIKLPRMTGPVLLNIVESRSPYMEEVISNINFMIIHLSKIPVVEEILTDLMGIIWGVQEEAAYMQA